MSDIIKAQLARRLSWFADDCGRLSIYLTVLQARATRALEDLDGGTDPANIIFAMGTFQEDALRIVRLGEAALALIGVACALTGSSACGTDEHKGDKTP